MGEIVFLVHVILSGLMAGTFLWASWFSFLWFIQTRGPFHLFVLGWYITVDEEGIEIARVSMRQ